MNVSIVLQKTITTLLAADPEEFGRFFNCVLAKAGDAQLKAALAEVR